MRTAQRFLPCTAVLLLAGAVGLAQAQAASAPRAPGVTRAVEHPDNGAPDPSVDQSQPDAHQPATAADPKSEQPETARDHDKLKPETATDAPKPTADKKASDLAKQGVRSNTPPSAGPHS